MQTEYALEVKQDPVNSVAVYRQGAGARELVWVADLDGDDEPVVLCEFYAPEQFVVMNWEGWLRAFDVSTREKIFEHDFEADLDSKAAISADGARLYVAANQDYKAPKLTVFSLPELELVAVHELPADTGFEQLAIRKDGSVLLYGKHHVRTESGDTQWSHGYTVVDPETGAVDWFTLASPPRDMFYEGTPSLDLRRGLGAVVNWDNVEVVREAEGSPRFVQKINLFDLDRFALVRTIAVREFEISQLTAFEASDAEAAEEALTTFNENLYSIVFCDSDDAIWLAWRTGVFRRVGLDGSARSPLLVVTSGHSFASAEPFAARTLHTYLEEVRPNSLEVSVYDDRFQIDLTNIDLGSSEPVIEVALEPLADAPPAVVPDDLEQQLRDSGYVVVPTSDVEQDDGILAAIEQIEQLTEDIGSIRRAHQLAFRIRDQKGRELEDEELFSRAAEIDEARPRVQAIIEHFVSYPDAEELYIHEEATALCYAAHFLGQADPAYIGSALRYLSVIDYEHDVYCQESMIPGMLEHYRGTEHYPKLMLALLALDAWDARECHLFAAFRDPESEFRTWFDEGGREQVPEIMHWLRGSGLRLWVEPEDEPADGDLAELYEAVFGGAAAGGGGTGGAAPPGEGASRGGDAGGATSGRLPAPPEGFALHPAVLGWNYLKQENNHEAGKMLLGQDISHLDNEQHTFLAFAGIADMAMVDAATHQVVGLSGMTAYLLPRQVDVEAFGGLMHQVEGESFLRLPGLMQFGAIDYAIDYLCSGKLAPGDVEFLRLEAWNANIANLVLNLPKMYENEIEKVLFFLQPPFHTLDEGRWDTWLSCMATDHALSALPVYALQQLSNLISALNWTPATRAALPDYRIDELSSHLRAELARRGDAPAILPDWSDYVEIAYE
ncbi:MAG: hypothetical protein ACOC8L_08380 [Spirochaetota bacterium]